MKIENKIQKGRVLNQDTGRVSEQRKREIRDLFNAGRQRIGGPFHIKEIAEMYKLRIDPGPPDSPEGVA